MKVSLAFRKRRAWPSLAVVVACVLVLPGCGSKKQSLSGKVTVGDKIVPAGEILFHPASSGSGGEHTAPAAATLSKSGEYSVSNLPKGELIVTVNTDSIKKLQESMDPAAKMGMKPPPGVEVKKRTDLNVPEYVPVPDKYKDPKTSPLRVTITGGSQKQDFKLTE